MTRAELRQALADACSTVTGITGYPRRPSAIKAGDAWPQWGGADRDDESSPAFWESWRILVALPGDEASADAYADRADEFLDALQALMYVDRIAPVELTTGDSTYALMISGRTE